MKIKFNKFERVAGFFVLSTIVGTIIFGAVIAVKKGWFERKVELKTTFESAGGITPGSQVQMAGLRVGSVESVELVSDNKVVVIFSVPMRHFSKIRKDSVVHTIRPFLIGDKVLEISVGSNESAHVEIGEMIPSEPSTDLMDIIGGRKLASYLDEMSGVLSSLKPVLKAFANEGRAERLVKIFDEILPLLVNVNMMASEMTVLSKQATRKKNLQKIVENLVQVTAELNDVLPQVADVMKNNPNLTQDMVGMIENLSRLTQEMTKVIPAIAEVAPELPRASHRAIEAMEEAVIVLKAMQKSFLLKGSVSEVREEEALAKKNEEEKNKKEKERLPASEQSK